MRLILIFLSGYFLLTSCDDKNSDLKENKEKANLYASKGEYKRAIYELNEYIKYDSNNIDVYLDLGYFNLLNGNYHEAITNYSKVINIDKANTLAYFNRAIAHHYINDLNNGLKDINNAISTKGGDIIWVEDSGKSTYESDYDVSMVELRFERGNLLLESGDINNSINDFNFCIVNNFNTDICYYKRANIYFIANQKNQACKDLNQAKSLGYVMTDSLVGIYCNY